MFDQRSLTVAGLIAAAQEAEHFEIAMYGTLRTWVARLGKNDAMEALEVTLDEEKAADALLTNIAVTLTSAPPTRTDAGLPKSGRASNVTEPPTPLLERTSPA